MLFVFAITSWLLSRYFCLYTSYPMTRVTFFLILYVFSLFFLLYHCGVHSSLLFFNSEAPKGESNYEAAEFDPIAHHNQFCPWVNGNVAAAGSSISGSGTGADTVALCGWQLTLDALDVLQSLGPVAIQTVQSESAASLYKVFLVCYNLWFCYFFLFPIILE